MKHARDDYNRIQDPDGLIPADEPVFLLRAQDKLAPTVVEIWAKMLRAIGGDFEMVEKAMAQARAMQSWQIHQRKRKTPDL
jgi:hypothetical protein